MSRYDCQHCSYQFRYKLRLSRHVKTVPDKSKRLTSSVCEFKTDYTDEMRDTLLNDFKEYQEKGKLSMTK